METVLGEAALPEPLLLSLHGCLLLLIFSHIGPLYPPVHTFPLFQIWLSVSFSQHPISIPQIWFLWCFAPCPTPKQRFCTLTIYCFILLSLFYGYNLSPPLNVQSVRVEISVYTAFISPQMFSHMPGR